MKDKLDQVTAGRVRCDGTDLHLNDTLVLYEVAAQPIGGQLTDNAANLI